MKITKQQLKKLVQEVQEVQVQLQRQGDLN